MILIVTFLAPLCWMNLPSKSFVSPTRASHAPITPNFPSGLNREIVEDYVQK